jgi:SAM-dependent methyltransferase
MSQDKQLYESDHVWDQEIQQGQKNLLKALIDFIPKESSSILDVGCGDGKITQQLINITGKRIVGLDSSIEALSRCSFETVLGDATAIDFADNAFDTVMTTDMLEHLPDHIEMLAWQELFRVSEKFVIVAVPFREELMDGMSLCETCGNNYHVNWHMRSYDWPELLQRTPDGWRATHVIITGEPWSPSHPIETHFRRELLNEWSGWDDAICPYCKSPGKSPSPSKTIPSRTAIALGKLIYSDRLKHNISRTHSEVLVIYCREQYTNLILNNEQAVADAIHQQASIARLSLDKLENNLVPYPVIGRAVAAADGGIIIQLPIYKACNLIKIGWKNLESPLLSITVEDGLGLVFSGNIKPQNDGISIINLHRLIVPSYFGLLVRFEMNNAISTIALEDGPFGIYIFPKDHFDVGYHNTYCDSCPVSIQVTDPIWINTDCLTSGTNSPISINWQNLFDEFELLSQFERDTLQVERDTLQVERDTLQVERDTLQVERDTLQVERDTLQVELKILNSWLSVRLLRALSNIFIR